MEKYKVKYTLRFQIPDRNLRFDEGYDLAESHRQDIRGYEGVTNAYLVPVESKT